MFLAVKAIQSSLHKKLVREGKGRMMKVKEVRRDEWERHINQQLTPEIEYGTIHFSIQ